MSTRTIGEFPLEVEAVSQAATVYSGSMPFRHCTGEVSALITVAGTTSITITQQVSSDNVTFYDAVDASNNALGSVAATMSAGTRYVAFSPVLARYIRFKVVENNTGAATVTIRVFAQEEV